jgi:peptide/nickel transport system substrate-binding protein
MYPPLYWMGTSKTPFVNYRLSLAYPPTFTNGGTSVLIRLKHYHWSNGDPVTSRDVEFWMNLLIANKADWAAYVPGAFPANVTTVKVISPSELTITFNRAYNQKWILYNELSQVFPIPQAVWDKTSSSGAVGNYDETAAGARAVYSFLNQQSEHESTYTTNPLWQVVDGPYRLSAFSPSTGYTVLSPNREYSGQLKPEVKVEELPFTSDAAEFDALTSGSVDYGYLPFTNLGQMAHIASQGFKLYPWVEWAVTYMPINFTNPTTGPVFSQLYVRQAMQYLIDQPLYVKDVFHSYATATYGPVPVDIRTSYLDSQQGRNPYPYDPAKAKALLSSHGWSLASNGISRCTRPGSSGGDCGVGITKGQSLSFSLLYASGNPALTAELESIQSAFDLVGFHVTLSESPASTVFAESVPCDPTTKVGCSWSLMDWGEAWGYNLDFYPTGGEIFETGAASNYGGYNNATMDKLIVGTHDQSGTAALYKYENYAAKQLPVLWMPNLDIGLSEVKTEIRDVGQGPVNEIVPQGWRIAK